MQVHTRRDAGHQQTLATTKGGGKGGGKGTGKNGKPRQKPRLRARLGRSRPFFAKNGSCRKGATVTWFIQIGSAGVLAAGAKGAESLAGFVAAAAVQRREVLLCGRAAYGLVAPR